jgi:hypothetical protein
VSTTARGESAGSEKAKIGNEDLGRRPLLKRTSAGSTRTVAADEFVVNALRHTKSGGCGGTFAVEVCLGSERVVVAVTDQGGRR